MYSARPRHAARRGARRLAVAAVSTLLGLAALEAVLRLLPRPPASALANAVYTAYGSFPGGIYVTDPESGIDFMVPSFATENFWNGYRWGHSTDALGFRNPPELADRSLLLLGDSLIYGHGVEEGSTVAARLRTIHGRPAYNMARQGDCIHEEYVLLRLFAPELAPRDVVLFVFLNDVGDLLAHREDGRLPPLERDWEAMRRRVAALGAHPRYPLGRQLYRCRSLRLLRGLAGLLRGPWMAHAAAAPDGAAGDEIAAPVLDDRAFATAAEYYRRALAILAGDLHGRGARLWVVHLDVDEAFGPRGSAAAARLGDFLETAANEIGLGFATTRGLFTGCAECFLPADGHLSPAGHARLARFVDAVLATGGR